MGEGSRPPTWIAVAAGAGLGFLVAFAGVGAWNLWPRRETASGGPTRDAASLVDLFRLASVGRREMYLVPAGPDAAGEPVLATALFPEEDPPRELASLLLANVSPDEPWLVDLDAKPLACRRSDAAPWEPIGGVASAVAAGGERLNASALLRLRGLGAVDGKLTVEPKTLRRVLLALPPKCRLGELSDVRWGDTPLLRDRLELERVRRFREDPAAVTAGR
jgi:hypothetical protein